MNPTGNPLESAGWHPGRNVEPEALAAALKLASMARGDGVEFPLFPAARTALREFYGLRFAASERGVEVAPTGCSTDPLATRYSLPQLAQLSSELRLPLYPLGLTESEYVLAVGEEGQLLTLGVGGCWQVGDSVAEGITNLTTGAAPRRLTSTVSAWRLPEIPGAAPVDSAVQAALSGVYILHHFGIYSAKGVGFKMTSLRGSGVEVGVKSLRIPNGALEHGLSSIVNEIREILAAHAGAAGYELSLSVEVPESETGPAGAVLFAVRWGHLAMSPNDLECTLSAGPGASTGKVYSSLGNCSKALEQYVASSVK